MSIGSSPLKKNHRKCQGYLVLNDMYHISGTNPYLLSLIPKSFGAMVGHKARGCIKV